MNDQFKEWHDDNQKANRYLGMARGILGYLFKVKRYNWPELEKRILDPKYFATGAIHLGPDWIQHGRGGDRWEEFEETLFKLWKYTTANPYRNQKDVEAASMLSHNLPGSGFDRFDQERAKLNISEHMKLHGNVENMIDIVKYTKRALGGGAGGSEEIAWNEAKDAWWNRPEVVALYWGNGGIVKKQKPSEKKREYQKELYLKNRDQKIQKSLKWTEENSEQRRLHFQKYVQNNFAKT